MLEYVPFALIALTWVWVAIDAHRNQIPTGKGPYARSNAVSWFLCCMLLWIIAFPFYLFKRARTLKERHGASRASTTVSVVGALLVVGMALWVAAPFLGWQRLSVEQLSEQVSTSVQSTWRNNPASQGIRLISISLVRRQGNEYGGKVVAEVDGRVEEHPIDVTYDGKVFTWKVQ